jgi:transposase
MSVYAKVRRLRLREGLSISEIARRTSLSRNTIKKGLAEPVRREMRYRREPMARKVDAHRQWLRDALAVDAMRPRMERRTARRLHEQLKAEAFEGDYSRVTEAIRAIRAVNADLIRTYPAGLKLTHPERFSPPLSPLRATSSAARV